MLEALLGVGGLFGVKVAGAVAEHDVLAAWDFNLQGVKFAVGRGVGVETDFVESGGVLVDGVEQGLEVAAFVDRTAPGRLGKLADRSSSIMFP